MLDMLYAASILTISCVICVLLVGILVSLFDKND